MWEEEGSELGGWEERREKGRRGWKGGDRSVLSECKII